MANIPVHGLLQPFPCERVTLVSWLLSYLPPDLTKLTEDYLILPFHLVYSAQCGPDIFRIEKFAAIQAVYWLKDELRYVMTKVRTKLVSNRAELIKPVQIAFSILDDNATDSSGPELSLKGENYVYKVATRTFYDAGIWTDD